jgi:hypothetical protein
MRLDLFFDRLMFDWSGGGRLDLSGLGLANWDLKELAKWLMKAETPEEGRPQLPDIVDLWLDQNPDITGDGLRRLTGRKKLAKLKALDLWCCKVDDETLLLITELFPELENIVIGGRRLTVTFEGLSWLVRLPRLKYVTVDRKRYAEDLKELRPELNIAF